MTESGSMAYRVIPKCACSTIGQIMYYTDHGEYFDGDIHDATAGIHKWSMEESRPLIEKAVKEHGTFIFTSVRNPYARILSAFFDKICGIQRNGRRYRGNLVPLLIQKYGIEVGSPEDGFDFDQIRSFRRFLLFVRDTIRFRKPMDPDIHWSAMSSHAATLVCNGGRFDMIVRVESIQKDMNEVLKRVKPKHRLDVRKMPRFNESSGHGPKRLHPVEDYFDDLSMHLVYEIYRKDFDLFRYDFENPANRQPTGEIDLEEVHYKLCE